MIFFTDIQDLKKTIGGAINPSIEEENISTEMRNAYEKFIRPYIHRDYWDHLVERWEDDNLTPKEEKLVSLLKQSLAYFSIFELITIGSVQLTDSGLTRQESEHHKSAYKYQEDRFAAKMHHLGYLYLERTLRHITNYITQYELFSSESDDWDAYKEIVPGILNFADDAQKSSGKEISRETFETMTGACRDIERYAIWPAIGEGLFDALYKKEYFSHLTTIDAPTPEEKKAIHLIRKVVASLAIVEAIKTNLVHLDGKKVMNVNYKSSNSDTNATPPDGHINLRVTQSEIQGNRYMIDLKKYMEENESEFPLYEPFQSPKHTTHDQSDSPIFNF